MRAQSRRGGFLALVRWLDRIFGGTQAALGLYPLGQKEIRMFVQYRVPIQISAVAALAMLTMLPGVASANVYWVSNTNDSGAGSLRQAITDANGHLGYDQIHFDIPGAYTHTIQPATTLPWITDPLLIDGYTQSLSAPATHATPAVLRVVLDGSLTSAEGLVVTASESTIRGLAVGSFPGHAVVFLYGGGNVLEGNHIGTDASGTSGRGNGTWGYGIPGVLIVQSSDNRIGGPAPEQRNVISGNQEEGLEITGVESIYNQVQGNYIGVDAYGTSALPNGYTDGKGIRVSDSASDNIIGGPMPGAANVVSGNAGTGIIVSGHRNEISHNLIGTDYTGTLAIGNDRNGVQISGGNENYVGGNVIANNGFSMHGSRWSGVRVDGGALRNYVWDNHIGTDASDTLSMGNGASGVEVGQAWFTYVLYNTIGNNDHSGVRIDGAAGVYVLENRIGVGIGGNNLSNLEDGVLVVDGSWNIYERNVIRYNEGAGVRVIAGIANLLNANRFSMNGALGIDLGEEGVARNDHLDGDGGANMQQNFPLLRRAERSETSTWIDGELASTPNTTFHLQFFQSETADPSNYGEGDRLIATVDVTTAADGVAGFGFTIPGTLSEGSVVTATATDPNANTSEFSEAIEVN